MFYSEKGQHHFLTLYILLSLQSKIFKCDIVKRNVYQNARVKHLVAPICNELVTESTFRFLTKINFVCSLTCRACVFKSAFGEPMYEN